MRLPSRLVGAQVSLTDPVTGRCRRLRHGLDVEFVVDGSGRTGYDHVSVVEV